MTPEESHPALKLTHYANAGFIQYCNDVDDNKLPPKFQAGDPVSIRVGDYAQFYGQKSRSRWVFIMNPQQVEENKMSLEQSLLRNSVIFLDLLKDTDDLSQGSFVSEHTEVNPGEINVCDDSIS